MLGLLVPHVHRLCYHIFEAVFTNALHVSLVAEHFAQVFNLLLVADAGVLKQLIVLLEGIFVGRRIAFRVVQ